MNITHLSCPSSSVSESNPFFTHLLLNKTCQFIAPVLLFITLTSCDKAGPNDIGVPAGTIIDRFVFVSALSSNGTILNVEDIYDDGKQIQSHPVHKFATYGFRPQISPDRTWMIYMSLATNLPVELHRISIDGSNDTRVFLSPESLNVGPIALSPDGRQIVFDYYLNWSRNGSGIGVVSVDAGDFKSLRFDDNTWNMWPRWSAGGNQIYASWYDFSNVFGHNTRLSKAYIRRFDNEGHLLGYVSNTSIGSDDLEFDVSLTSGDIVVLSRRAFVDKPAFGDLYVMDSTGGNSRLLLKGEVGTEVDGHYLFYAKYASPKWLKGGTHVVFNREYWKWDNTINNYTTISDVWCIRQDGTGLTNLTNDGNANLNLFKSAPDVLPN